MAQVADSGRWSELSVFDEVARRALAGRGSALLIEGEAGIGKSWLLDRFVGRGEEFGMRTRRTQGDELERGLPFGFVAPWVAEPEELLSGFAPAQMSSLVHPLGSGGGPPEAALARITSSVEVFGSSPALLVADDAQWADRWSLVALRRLARWVAQRPVVVLVAFRVSTDAPTAVGHDSLVRSGAARLSLGPLSRSASIDLARSWFGAEPGPHLRSLVTGAGGHPLLLVELLRGIQDEGVVRQAGRVDILSTRLPRTVREAVSWRLRRLDPTTKDVLQWAAVLGNRFDPTHLAAVGGWDRHELIGALRIACREGLLVEAGDEHLMFGHDLVRDAVYEGLPKALRTQLHGVIADGLAASSAPPRVIVGHLATAGRTGDPSLVLRLRSAATEIGPGDPARALELLDAAKRLAPPEQQAAIDLERAMPLAWTGQASAADELLEQAITAAVAPNERVTLRRVRAGLLVLQGRISEALDQLTAAAEESDGSAEQALVQATVALARLTLADPTTSESAIAAVRLGRALDEPTAVALGLSVLGRDTVSGHRYAQAERFGADAVQAAERADGELGHRYAPWFFHGLTLLDLDRHDDVANAVALGREISRRLGTEWAEPLYCGLAAAAAFRRGRVLDALEEARAGTGMALDHGAHQALAWCEALDAMGRFLIDDAAAAPAADAAIHAWESGRGLLGIDHVFLVRAWIEEAQGAPDVALGTLEQAWQLLSDAGLANCLPLLGPDLVRLASTAGQRRLAVKRVEQLWGAAMAADLQSLRAIAARAEGWAEGATESFEWSIGRFDELGRGIDAALAAADRATVLSRRGDSGTTVAAAEARLRAGRLGLSRVARAMDRLIGLGDTGSRDRRPAPSLTPAEREVAQLVAAGLSNIEIARRRRCSVRTVESHLSRAYAKLGCTSRVQLALAVDRGRSEQR